MSVKKVVRALVGIVVLVVLGLVVMNYWTDYRSARTSMPSAPAATADETTATGGLAVVGVGTARIDGVNFRTKPASSATLIRSLKKGEKVTVLLKDGQWYQVKDSKGKTGWVTANADYVAFQKK